MVVTFDNMVLIWGIKGVSTDGQEDRIDAARHLIDTLRDRKIEMSITAPVLSEYVGSFPVEQQQSQVIALSQNFVVYPFDTRAASIAAELLYNHPQIDDLKDEYGVARWVIKSDVMIVASAIAAGVEKIYTGDGKIMSIANRSTRIIAEDIPDPPQQQKDLFDD